MRALVLAVWSILGVKSAEAPVLADAIATAVAEDAKNDPVLETHEADAALLAVVVLEESNVQTHPTPNTWDAASGLSCGAFQLRCAGLPATLAGQARRAVWHLHKGREVCPVSPAAPYVGGCRSGPGRVAGDRRVAKALATLRVWAGDVDE